MSASAGTIGLTATATPKPGGTCGPVAFNVTVTNNTTDSSPTFTYGWTFGDGGTATGASVTHTYAAPGTYTATVTVGDGTTSNSATVFVVIGATSVPAPPTYLIGVEGYSAASLSWTPSAGPCLSYNVFRTDQDGQTVGMSAGSDSTFTDTGLVNGETYTYYVTASSSAGESSPSNVVTIVPGLYAPTNVTGVQYYVSSTEGNEVTVSWTGEPGINNYYVYRADGSYGIPAASAYQFVGATALTEYSDQSPTQYTGQYQSSSLYYEVVSVAPTWATSDPSDPSSAVNYILLSYYSSAQSGTLNISPDNQNVCIGVPTVTNIPLENDGLTLEFETPVFNAPGASDITWSDPATEGASIAYVNAVPSTMTFQTLTAAPQAAQTCNLITFSALATACETNDPITYTWSFGDGGSAVGATVAHAYTHAGNDWVTLTASFPGSTALGFDDPSVTAMTTYQEVITPSTGGLPAPQGLSSDGQYINWDAVPGAASYAVYRAAPLSNGTPGQFTQIATISALAYYDTSAQPGYTFYYAVSAIDGCGSTGTMSAPSLTTIPGVTDISGSDPVTIVSGNQCINQQITFQVSLYSNLFCQFGSSSTTVLWYVDGALVPGQGTGSTSSQFTTSFNQAGLHTVAALLTSVCSNNPLSSQVISQSTIVVANGLTVEAPTVETPQPSICAPVQFNDLAASCYGTLAYLWNFGDSSPYGAGASPTHQYTDAGTYPVSVTVTDSEGNTATQTTSVVISPPPSLPAPTGLNTQLTVTGIELAWTPVPNASGYNIYRASTPGGEGSTPIATVPATSAPPYIDTNVYPSNTYYYQVSAIGCGVEGPMSIEISQSTAVPDTLALSLASNTTNAGDPDLATVTTSATAPVGGTNVTICADQPFVSYPWSCADPSEVTIPAGSNSTTFEVLTTPVVTHSSVDIIAQTGEGSEVGYAYQTLLVYPSVSTAAPPNGVAATSTGSSNGPSIIVSWSPVADATSYTAELSLDGATWSSTSTMAQAVDQSPATFGPTVVQPATLYYARVDATDGTNVTPWSPLVMVMSAPEPPTDLTATPGVGEVTLNWQASTSALDYEVAVAPLNADGSTQSGPFTVATVSSTSYIVTGLTGGVNYDLFVYSVGPGAVTSGVYVESSPTAGSGQPPPTSLYAIPKNSGNWYCALNWQSSIGAAQYDIYRENGSGAGGSGFEDILSVSASSNGNNYAFGTDDDTIGNASGATYSYYVVAIGPGGTSVPSNIAVCTTGSAIPNMDIPAPAWAEDAVPSDAAGGGDAGPSSALDVSLPGGVAEEDSGPDISAYNPLGPSVSYERAYRSSTASGQQLSYPSQGPYNTPGLTPGWTDNYDYVLTTPAPTSASPLPITLTYPSRATESWTPTLGNNQIVPPGRPYFVTLTPDPNSQGGDEQTYDQISLTFKDHTQYVFTADTSTDTCFHLTCITDIAGNVTTLNRDPSNGYWLTSITNSANTALLSFTYYDGLLNQVADAYGRAVTYDYSWGEPSPEIAYVSQVAPVGQVAPPQWIYTYTGNGTQLQSVATPCPDPAIGATYCSASLNYDEMGKVDGEQGADGEARNYTLNPTGVGVKVTDPTGKNLLSWTQNFTPSNQNVDAGFTDAANKTLTVKSVDPNTPYLPTEVDDRDALKSTSGYDAEDNVTKETDRLGVTTNYQIDYSHFPLGQVVQAQDTGSDGTSTLAPWIYTYEPGFDVPSGGPPGAIQQVFGPEPGWPGASMFYALYGYTALGDVSQVTGVMGRSIKYTYTGQAANGQQVTQESLGEPIYVTVVGTKDTDGNADYKTQTTGYVYNPNGTVATVYDEGPDGNLDLPTDYQYNVGDQVTQVTYPPADPSNPTARQRTKYYYAYVGGPVTTVQMFYPPTGSGGSSQVFRQVDYQYDAEGDLLSEMMYNSQTGDAYTYVSYKYDAAHRLQSMTDGDGNTTSYYYDNVGNLQKVVYPGNQTGEPFDSLTYAYYGEGEPQARVDGNGLETDYYPYPLYPQGTVHYDTAPGQPTYPDVVTSFDAFGRRQSMTDGTGTKNYTLDDLGNPLTISGNAYSIDTVQDGKGPNVNAVNTITNTYYFDGSRNTMTLTGSNAIGSGYDYYVQIPIMYGYDALGQMTAIQTPYSNLSYGYYPNGWLNTIGHDGWLTKTLTYDGLGRLASLENDATLQGSSSQQLVSYYGGMTYDPAGNRTAETSTVPANSSQYSGLGEASRALGYQYDERDELLNESSTYTGSGSDTFGLNYNYSYAYDNAGNPTTFRGQSMGSYNRDNQNASQQYDGNGNPLGSTGTLTFDPENRLVSDTQVDGGWQAGYDGDGMRTWQLPGNPALLNRYYNEDYVYDGDQPLAETDEYGHILAVNVFGPAGLEERDEFGGNYYGLSDVNHYTYDPAGNVDHIINDGTITEAVAYDAFGNQYPATDASNTGDDVGFGGEYGYYHDWNTGYYLLTHRFYNPMTGRFITRDPIGYEGGIDLYAFTGNNPITGSDPSGLKYPAMSQFMDRKTSLDDYFDNDHDHDDPDEWEGVKDLIKAAVLISSVSDGLDFIEGASLAAREQIEGLVARLSEQPLKRSANGERGFAAIGRGGKQARLRQLGNDPKVSSADRGWIKQERNAIARGSRRSIRVPPGKVMAHLRGMRARNGNSYLSSALQNPDLHLLEHKYGGYR